MPPCSVVLTECEDNINSGPFSPGPFSHLADGRSHAPLVTPSIALKHRHDIVLARVDLKQQVVLNLKGRIIRTHTGT